MTGVIILKLFLLAIRMETCIFILLLQRTAVDLHLLLVKPWCSDVRCLEALRCDRVMHIQDENGSFIHWRMGFLIYIIQIYPDMCSCQPYILV